MTERPDWVTTRDLYEKVGETEEKLEGKVDTLESKVDANHKDVADFMSKAKIAFAVLFLLLASPKAGGPSADQVLSSTLKLFV
jgi:hypothetical protein